ncbi:class I SAM-dependent methyltransferase [Fodinicola feengrottensis]|uniref:Methyltransferase domain-containing protein n=1 Tax=Fodinicola feengrottensis TaxID=435914 RepID=A0ABP4UIU4_9ACTN|nr:methyltransferase domain-containing protein [Fodinicola feengrottensis]
MTSTINRPKHDWRVFAAAALREPSQMGTFFPTGEASSAALAQVVPGSGDPVVVELGPGTGAVSDVISRRLGGRGRHVAVEIDPTLVAHLRTAKPDLEVLLGDAADLGKLLADAGVGAVDAVVSALPWTLFPAALQTQVVRQIAGVLSPGGAFSTIAYLSGVMMPRGQRFRRQLRHAFDEVVVTSTVWRNLPPALTYVCRRPVVR